MTDLKPIADRVWGVETQVNVGLGVSLPLRMVVLQDDRGLSLHSPIRIDSELATRLERLGPVHTLLGPNRLHYRYLAAARERYPDAKVLGAPGLAEKKPEISFDGVLSRDGSPSLDLELQLIEGADKLSEVVFLHKPSRTLVVTDLVFNIPSATGLSWFALAVFSRALGRCEQSRLCRMLTNDRRATANSVAQLLRWPFERVVPAHGDVIDTDAPQTLEHALWWMRGLRQPDVG